MCWSQYIFLPQREHEAFICSPSVVLGFIITVAHIWFSHGDRNQIVGSESMPDVPY